MAETERELQTYLRGRPVSPPPIFFFHRFGKPFTINAPEKLLKGYFVKTGLPSLRIHHLRHTFAVHFLYIAQIEVRQNGTLVNWYSGYLN